MVVRTFHGSLHNNINTFNTFAHFGSRKAAAEAAYRHIHFGKAGTPHLYEVTISLAKANTINIKDWSSAQPINLATALDEYYSPKKIFSFKDVCDSISISEARDQSLFKSQFNKLYELLISLGVKGIYYPNAVEGNYGEKTLCLVDVSCISKVRKMDFTQQELDDAKQKVEKKYIHT